MNIAIYSSRKVWTITQIVKIMGSIPATKKPHVVLVPYPAQGHINPTMKLAKLLHTNGFHITFVNTNSNHKLFIRTNGPDWLNTLPRDFGFETIPDGIPSSDWDPTSEDVPMSCYMVPNTCLVHFKELVLKLNSSEDVPPVSCIITDAVLRFGVQAGKDLGIPQVQFWTASAGSFVAYLHYHEFISRGIVPFKDESYLTDGTLEQTIDWIDGMSNIRYKDVPTFIRTTNPDDIMFDYMGDAARNCLNASAIIFNSFDAFEHQALQTVRSKFNYNNMYTIGPLPLLEKYIPKSSPIKSLDSSLWKQDSSCIWWLDKREPESVIYVNHGSATKMTDQHFKEFAWGLADSKHPFIWIVRVDLIRGDSRTLLEGFWEETKDRGLIVSWCPQDQVLGHPSIGAFLTHCGWNSTIESVSEGVPTICWPDFADQQTNSRYLCMEWEMGTEMNQDVKREEVELLVKEMLVGEEGKEKRRKAREWKWKAKEAIDVGGSSYANLKRFMKEALKHEL